MAEGKSTTLRDRFEAKVDRSGGPDACHEWKASLHTYGYGRIHDGTRVTYAHRVAWRLERGEIPNGLFVLHRCDNPPCVNVQHLFLGTHRDNVKDMREKGRGIIGESHPNTSLTREQVKEIRRLRGKVTQGQLARRFGVSPSSINLIQLRKRWQHVD